MLFEDDFSSYEPAETIVRIPFKDQLTLGHWRVTTLHYVWTSRRFLNWTVTGFPWSVADRDGVRCLEMPDRLMNVVLAAGDADWQDYTFRFSVAWTGEGTIGALFRYQTSRRCYGLDFVDGRTLRLMRREDAQEVVLAERACPCVAGQWRAVEVRLEDPRIRVTVDGVEVFDVDDDRLARGRIGLRAEGTGRFASVRVTADPAESAQSATRARARDLRRQERSRRHPPCVLERTVTLPRSYSFVHASDLDGDGSMEYVGFVADVLADDYTNISGVGVHDASGRELWYHGRPQTSDRPLHSDVAYQVGSLDGGARPQLLFTRDFKIHVVDALTGKVIRTAPTPESVKGTEDRFPRIVGDSFHLCNLRGRGRRDFLLKDRYCNIWAYTAELEPLWHRTLNTGHYPRAADIDGDGRDEVMAGYSLLDADGRTRWTVPGSDPDHNRYPGPEHADSLWIGRFKEGPDTHMEIAMAASDLGFNLLDANGNLLVRDLCGHAQSLGIARFRADLPGRQFVVSDFWGNIGITAIFDCYGNRLADAELDFSPVPVPVKWDAAGEALFWGGGESGCLLDGTLSPVVSVPKGSGVRPSFRDVNGDGLDEFLVLEGREIRVYGRPAHPGASAVPDNRTFENYSEYGAFYL